MLFFNFFSRLLYHYTPYEGLTLSVASQSSRTLGVFGGKLEGSLFPFHCYFDMYLTKYKNNVQMISSSLI